MKSEQSNIDKRQRLIIEILKTKHTITVKELSDILHINPITIRRDLSVLEKEGHIEKYYGGARLIQGNNQYSYIDHTKIALAEYAASFIDDFDIIFINSSSTALLVIPFIKRKAVTIITNNANVLHMQHDANVSIFLTGGILHNPKKSLIGDLALTNLKKVMATKCFIGCDGISYEHGITTNICEETNINQMMIAQSKQTFVITEHQKIGRKKDFITSTISDIHHLITDHNCPTDLLKSFEKASITLHVI